MTWIPFGDYRPGSTRASHLAPRAGPARALPGRHQRVRDLLRLRRLRDFSKVGQLAANHFASIVPDDGWQDRLREVGRRCLWEGAQEIEIVEV